MVGGSALHHEQVHVEGQHRIYKDSERSLHHKTDGIIFQPDAPYKVGTDPALLKWKWIDLASVDLRVYPAALGNGGAGGGGGGVRLCSEAGNHGEEVDLSRSVHLSEHDEARLVADMQNSRSVIAEVALDPGSGLWVYMGLRPDKDRPNFITTVISTMVEVRFGFNLWGNSDFTCFVLALLCTACLSVCLSLFLSLSLSLRLRLSRSHAFCVYTGLSQRGSKACLNVVTTSKL